MYFGSVVFFMLSRIINFLKNRSLVFKLSTSILLTILIGSFLLSIFISNYSKPLLKEQVVSSAYKALGEVNHNIAQGADITEQSIVNTARILELKKYTNDEELKLLYQRCSVLFLPLKRFTANNALLESASCGCNILISANAMVNGYLPENQICITDFDLDKVVDRIQTYLVCPSVNLKLSSYIAENYSWEKIAQETQSLFASLN